MGIGAGAIVTALHYSRLKREQGQRIPSIQRQVLDLVLSDDVANRCVGSLNPLVAGLDLHRLRGRAQLQSCVDYQGSSDGQNIVHARVTLKSSLADGNAVSPRGHGRKSVIA